MILPSPFGGRWLEEPDEGRVFEIAYERVIEARLPLISPLRGQLPPLGEAFFVAFAFPYWGKVARRAG